VFDTTLVDEVCQLFAAGRWFSPCTPDSSTNTTDRHNITEMLLNVALSTINLTLNVCTKVFIQLQLLNGVFKLITPHFIETSFKFCV